jgi:hypothetical protein
MPRVARGRRGSPAWRRSAAATLTGPARHSTPDDQVAHRCHSVRAAAAVDLAGVLGEGDVAKVQRLDGPVPAQQVGEAGGAGLLEAEAGDRVDGHGLEPPRGVQGTGRAGDLDALGGVGKAEASDADGLEGADLHAAVAAGHCCIGGDRAQATRLPP